jgi:hypothetical protein
MPEVEKMTAKYHERTPYLVAQEREGRKLAVEVINAIRTDPEPGRMLFASLAVVGNTQSPDFFLAFMAQVQEALRGAVR